jgi:hypothetical protein
MPTRIEEIDLQVTEPQPAPAESVTAPAQPLDPWRLAAALRREHERRARLVAD